MRPSTLPKCVVALLLLPAALLHESHVHAGDVQFRRHVINPASEFSACAAFDVNHDGRLDIIAGGWWYEGPTWKQHKLREVQMIRGRFDDYSNLQMDVNGDGWMDLVSCNYRSRSLYWVRHPGASLGFWRKHVIDTPGPSETGRLADVDGDGDPDLLPNGVDFAAWYEVVHDPEASGQPRWIRHDLPPEIVGHGIGFGDINGDGRGDLVNPRGWLESPEDRRTGRWRWHGDFRLHRDSGLPILVHDFDGDGDNDILWGRGHNIGVYWLEQRARANPSWVFHAIDTSWSEAHSLMMADIDGDGGQDVVAGKRYLGHDGKDPGEYDPLCIYWYAFDRNSKTWKRHLVSWGERCGFDLDPKCADIDGDGDVDIVAAARSGLFLLENLLHNESDEENGLSSQPPETPAYQDHSDVLVFRDSAGEMRPAETREDWCLRRAHILANMQRIMGPLPQPSRRVPLDVQFISRDVTSTYTRHRITYAAEPGDRVPAFLLIPEGLTQPAAAMLCLHPTSPLGKAQICGLGGKPSRFYAHELAERGYVCLAPDYPSFGDYTFDFHAQDMEYVSGSMKAIWNNIRGLDLLESLPEVHTDKIGCIGHSLGGHNGLFTAAFDQRIRAMVTSCGFNAFEDYYEGDLTGWSSDRYMPRIRDTHDCDPRHMPFDFHEVIAAMAPRPLFVNAPLHDANFAVVGVRKAVRSAERVYELCGAAEKLHVVYPDAEHDFPEDVRRDAYKWLDETLKRK